MTLVPALPECPECRKALSIVVHEWYADDCPDCEIRRLAYLPSAELTQELDEIEHKQGHTARVRIYQRLRVEKARIAVLNEMMPKRAKA